LNQSWIFDCLTKFLNEKRKIKKVNFERELI